MGVLPLIFLITYVGAFVVLGMVAYAFFKGTRSVERHAGMAFWGVLAFGGFGIVGLAVGTLLLLLWFQNTLLGSWVV